MYYTRFDTPFCEIILAGNKEGLTNLHLNTGKGKREFSVSPDWIFKDDFFETEKKQIIEYCHGKRKKFTINLNPQGTDFQNKVWNALSRIPYGELKTYKDIAITIGNKNASRAVGMANSKNPIPIIIPCHRVIGSGGNLTGFAHGLDIKERLIQSEQA